MKECDSMKWYVLNYDWNSKKVKPFNIFNSVRFSKCLQKSLEEFITMDDFKKDLQRNLMYSFWSKREYEISVGDLHENDMEKYQRFDIYDQVLPNLDILAEYIIECYNNGIDNSGQ